jgi:hypothetical protein
MVVKFRKEGPVIMEKVSIREGKTVGNRSVDLLTNCLHRLYFNATAACLNEDRQT